MRKEKSASGFFSSLATCLRFILAFGFLTMPEGSLAANTVLGGGGLGPFPKQLSQLPSYMIHAAGLDDADYYDCVKKNTKLPADANLIGNHQAALACQDSAKKGLKL